MEQTPTAAEPTWAPREIMGISVSYMLARAVHVVTVLGIADHLASGPKTAAELARLTKTDARSLERLLLTLEAFRIFSRREAKFSLNEVSDPLRVDSPRSVRP